MTLAPRTRLGPYIIRSKLGEGGMGEVDAGTDTRLDRAVAIKMLGAATALSPDAAARFEREGRVIAALNHPNICTLFDVGTDQRRPYLVIDLLAGAAFTMCSPPVRSHSTPSSTTQSPSPTRSTLRTPPHHPSRPQTCQHLRD